MTEPLYQSPQDRLTQLIDTAIKAVESEQNSGRAVVIALDCLREIQLKYVKYVASHYTTITQHEPHMIDHSIPFNTDK